jgi:SAM-dependent methyltransferase
MTDPNEYYTQVAKYYDLDAVSFEKRYDENPVLKRIRGSFREITDKYPYQNALEIGCGPGFDVDYFARKNPESRVYAIDVSPEMVKLARHNCEQSGLLNTEIRTGSIEDVQGLFPETKFDLIYVFFGGLNTVHDLSLAAQYLKSVCTPQAKLVLTFVNRYYLTEIPLWLAKGRTDKALERIRGRWQGYSDLRKLPSKVFSAKDIRGAFGDHFVISNTRGYSIFYPAWYRSHNLKTLGSFADRLWRLDELVSSTPFWNIGEYSLYELTV